VNSVIFFGIHLGFFREITAHHQCNYNKVLAKDLVPQPTHLLTSTSFSFELISCKCSDAAYAASIEIFENKGVLVPEKEVLPMSVPG
jgi:hypothetical protein